MISKISFIPSIFLAAAIFLSGCGGGSSSTKITTPSVSVTAPATSVDGTDAVKLSAIVTNDTNNAGVTWTVSGAGSLSNTTTSAASYTAPAATSVAQTVKVTATSIADTAVSNSVTLTIPANLAITTTDAQLTAASGTAFSVQLTATGGIAPYNWSLPSSTTLPAGWALSSSGVLTGPAAANNWAGAFDLTVDLADSGTANPLTASAPLVVTVTPTANTAHNSYLSGTWVCSISGYFDSDGARWAALTSFQADGNGNLSAGVIDENSRDFTAALSGTLTGSYSVASDNNGLLTTKTVWSNGTTSTNSFAIALNNLAGPTASVFRMVESDDAGATPSGQHGEAVCELAKTTAFSASTLSGNSFVFSENGETAKGIPQRHVGLLSASNGQLSGIVEGANLADNAPESATLTGTYTVPDPTTGRFTATTVVTNTASGDVTNGQVVFYIYDANDIYRLQTVANGGLQVGTLNKQTATSYTPAILNGSFVIQGQGYEIANSSKSGDLSYLDQGTADGVGNLTINQSYQNNGGSYQSGQQNGETTALTFDTSNPGRATFTPADGGFGFLYISSKNQGQELIFNPTNGDLESGVYAGQTQTTFTDAALAGNYLHAPQAILEPTEDIVTGEFDLDASGNVTGNLSTTDENVFYWDLSYSSTYQWDSSAASNTGAFLIGSGSTEASCVVVSDVRALCIENTSPGARGYNLQQ